MHPECIEQHPIIGKFLLRRQRHVRSFRRLGRYSRGTTSQLGPATARRHLMSDSSDWVSEIVEAGREVVPEESRPCGPI
jgi:hypothetical protein